MIKLRTNLVLLWTVLILGLILAGACSNNNLTTPDPSDVLGIDPSGAPELQALLDGYHALRDQGGGVISQVDPDGDTIIGSFDSYTGNPVLLTRLTIIENGGNVTQMELNDLAIIPSLNFPITVTANSPGYVQKTIYQTNSNVIAIPMDYVDVNFKRAMVVGFTFGNGLNPPHEPWAVQASSTHLGCDWDRPIGLSSGTTPSSFVTVNPGQNVGCIAFHYGLVNPEPGEIGDPWQGFAIIGYSWSNIGILAPNAVGGWIMNVAEVGSGTTYGTANYTFTNAPPAGPLPSVASMLATLSFVPGGSKDASNEFIPYYPLLEIEAVDEGAGYDGTYELIAFLPPISVDRILVTATADYIDGSFERIFMPWDPAGAVPDITFGVPGSIDSAVVTSSPSPEFPLTVPFDCSWTDATPGGTPGFQVVTLKMNESTIWELYVGTDVRDISYDISLNITERVGISSGVSVNITRYNSAGIDLDDFDFQRVWANSTSWITSHPQPVVY